MTRVRASALPLAAVVLMAGCGGAGPSPSAPPKITRGTPASHRQFVAAVHRIWRANRGTEVAAPTLETACARTLPASPVRARGGNAARLARELLPRLQALNVVVAEAHQGRVHAAPTQLASLESSAGGALAVAQQGLVSAVPAQIVRYYAVKVSQTAVSIGAPSCAVSTAQS